MFVSSTRARTGAGLLSLLVGPLVMAPVAQAAWLGVQLQPVPSPLAAHVNLTEGGLLVENVMRDGPADRAGLDRWDIITAVDGQPVTADLAAFTEVIQNKSAGDAITVSYIHAGQPGTATVTLSERTDSLSEADWKYEAEPQDILQERIRVRGHTLTKDDKGNWMLRNILDLPGAVPLPGDLKELFQDVTMDVSVSTDEGGHRVSIAKQESDGERVQVVIQGDEPIVVRRTNTVGGKESTTEQTYPDMEALRQADPEVYELLNGTQQRGMLKMGPFGPDIDPRVLRLESLKRMESELDHSGQALADYLSTLTKKLDSCAIGLGGNKAMTVMPHPFCFSDKSSLAFRVQPDGEIEVTRRIGDSDLTDVYRDAEDLKARDPAMYERYQSLRSPAETTVQP